MTAYQFPGPDDPPNPKRRVFHNHAITVRQLECLAWSMEGKSASDIGGILGISARTVEGHLRKVCEHLGVKTRLQAVVKACALGLLDPTRAVSLRRRKG